MPESYTEYVLGIRVPSTLQGRKRSRQKSRQEKRRDFESLERRTLLAVDLGITPVPYPSNSLEVYQSRLNDQTGNSETNAEFVIGDVNTDGTFDETDLGILFNSSEYEDAAVGNSTWETGDFDGDGEFTSSDLVLAFQLDGFPIPLAAHGAEHSSATPLRVMTYNVQMWPRFLGNLGLNNRCCADYRAARISDEVLGDGIDIVGFQEVFEKGVQADQVDELTNPILEGWFGSNWRDFADHHRAFGPGGNALKVSSGLMLLSRYPIVATESLQFSRVTGSVDGSFERLANKGVLHARIRRAQDDFVDVYVTHLYSGSHPENRLRQFDQIAEFVGRTSDIRNPVIIMGDMNNDGRPRYGDSGTSHAIEYQTMLASFRSDRSGRRNLIDVWDDLHPDDQTRTELDNNDRRLDHIFFSDSLSGDVGELVHQAAEINANDDIVSRTLSDHAALTANFTWEIDSLPSVQDSNVATGLQWEYFDLNGDRDDGIDRLPNFDSLDPNHVDVISSGDFLNIGESRRTNQGYAIRYRGYLNVPQPGEYTFHLTSDDGSKLFIGDHEVVNNDVNPDGRGNGRHDDREIIGTAFLEAGLQPIRIEYFQHRGGKTLRLAWSGPGLDRAPLLPSDFVAPLRDAESPGTAEPGIEYTAYEGVWWQIPDFDGVTPTASGRHTGDDYLSRRTDSDRSGLRFDGYVFAPQDGLYTFQTRSDDGSRIFIGDQYLVNNDGTHRPQDRHGRILLEQGYHPIRIEYFDRRDGDELQVLWDGPGVGGLRNLSSNLFTLTFPSTSDRGDAPVEYLTSARIRVAICTPDWRRQTNSRVFP